MKLKKIPSFIGRSSAGLARDFGIPKQTLGQYLNGQRGKPSRLIAELLIFCNLNREDIIFPNRFDHPDGENPEHPAYWMNIALEALHEATKRGLPEQEALLIAEIIRQAIAPMLADIGG
jgi:hypothetical protein